MYVPRAMYSLRMSFWVVPAIALARDALGLGGRHVQGEQDRRRGVDRHRGADLAERQAVEQDRHVGEARDRDADPADLPLRLAARRSRSPSGSAGRRRPTARSGPARGGSGSAGSSPRPSRSPRTGASSRSGSRYIVGWTPRVNGYSPGRPRSRSSSRPAVSAGVYRSRIAMPGGGLERVAPLRGAAERLGPEGRAPAVAGRVRCLAGGSRPVGRGRRSADRRSPEHDQERRRARRSGPAPTVDPLDGPVARRPELVLHLHRLDRQELLAGVDRVARRRPRPTATRPGMMARTSVGPCAGRRARGRPSRARGGRRRSASSTSTSKRQPSTTTSTATRPRAGRAADREQHDGTGRAGGGRWRLVGGRVAGTAGRRPRRRRSPVGAGRDDRGSRVIAGHRSTASRIAPAVASHRPAAPPAGRTRRRPAVAPGRVPARRAGAGRRRTARQRLQRPAAAALGDASARSAGPSQCSATQSVDRSPARKRRVAGHEPVERQRRLDAGDLGLVERPRAGGRWPRRGRRRGP